MNELEFKLGNRERITEYHSPFRCCIFIFVFFIFFPIHVFMLLILTAFPVSYLILIIYGEVKR